MALFSKKGLQLLKDVYNTHKAELEHADFTDAIQKLIDTGITIYGLETYKGWSEVHTFDDYKQVSSMLK